MNQTKPKQDLFIRIASWIVDKRNLIFLFYAVILTLCVITRSWVSVNNEITDYLPDDTETRIGLELMEQEFITFGTANVMVKNITYEQAESIADLLESVPGVSGVTFGDTTDEDSGSINADDRKDYYRNSAALYSVTFDGEEDDPVSVKAMEEIRELLKEYDCFISSEVGKDDSAELAEEMKVILVIAAVIILVVMTLTSKTYGEIPVMLMTFVAAALLNMGTNYMLGEISFVSNSIAVVLQLALAIDYAIILCHRFSEERESEDARTACILALSKAIPEISSSCLTTLAGLTAMMFMQFQIGLDLGIVLVKAVLFSILAVFTLMPGLLMLFSGLIDRTHHRNFIPRITLWGRFVTKLKYVVPPLFACMLAVVFKYSMDCPYIYGMNSVKTEKKSESALARDYVEEVFGRKNIMAVIVPGRDYETEKQLLKRLENMNYVEQAVGLANIELEDDYVLTDALTPREFAEMVDMDVEICRLLYSAYAIDIEEYGRVLNNIDVYKIPVIDLFRFLYRYVGDGYLDDGYIELSEEDRADLDDLNEQVENARKQLESDRYSRILLTVDLPMEGEETFAFLDLLHEVIGEYYLADSFYVVGDSTSNYDLAASFVTDNVMISVLSIGFVILVLLFTFQSVGLPILLILVIQGSIWINFSFPTILNDPVFFLSYLIVSSIQMGANIDYAIVISSRYQELKQKMDQKEAIVETLNLAFPTVFTSGTILASAGILICKLTSNPAVYGVGLCLGRGTIISMVLVLGVLPEILLLGDTLIEKTSFNVKYPSLIQPANASGKVYLNGRIRGTVSGNIDAEVHGVLHGEFTGTVASGNRKTVQAEGEAKGDDGNEK